MYCRQLLVGKGSHSNKWCLVSVLLKSGNVVLYTQPWCGRVSLCIYLLSTDSTLIVAIQLILFSFLSNFGKLNYYLGAGAKNDGRPSKYPEVDFCKMIHSMMRLWHSYAFLF